LRLSDDAVYRRIQRSAPAAMRTLFTLITETLVAADPGDRTLAPFAAEVIALDETTLDPVARRGSSTLDIVFRGSCGGPGGSCRDSRGQSTTCRRT